MSDSVQPQRRQPTRLRRPWDSPGKNTGVGCHFFLQCMKVKSESEVAQSCLTLSNPMDCSALGSFVHGIFQARVLEWVATAFSLGEWSTFWGRARVANCSPVITFSYTRLRLSGQERGAPCWRDGARHVGEAPWAELWEIPRTGWQPQANSQQRAGPSVLQPQRSEFCQQPAGAERWILPRSGQMKMQSSQQLDCRAVRP